MIHPDSASWFLLLAWSVAAGLALGLFQTIFRAIGILLKRGRIYTFFTDFMLCLNAALLYLILLYNFSWGRIRFFAFAGMLVGFLAVILALGNPLAHFCVWLRDLLRKRAAVLTGRIRKRSFERRCLRKARLFSKYAAPNCFFHLKSTGKESCHDQA